MQMMKIKEKVNLLTDILFVTGARSVPASQTCRLRKDKIFKLWVAEVRLKKILRHANDNRQFCRHF